MVRVVLAVTEHARAALGRVGLVGGRAAVQLMEGALAEDRGDGDVGRRAQALVQLEVRVAAARHRERLVEAADLLQERPRHEEAVRLPEPVEPVAVADEMADLEEPVPVVRPVDRVEQRSS